MRIGKIMGVWAVLAALMVCNGALRVGVFEPLLGREAGQMMSAFVGIIIIFGASRPFLVSEPEHSRAKVLRISMMWLVLTILFEAGIAKLTGRGWAEAGRAYTFQDGSFWPVVLLAVAVAPFKWLRRSQHPFVAVTK